LLDKIKLEYVESAWIILYRLTNNEPHLLKGSVDLFMKNLKFVLDKFNHNELVFSGLFNAYTEDRVVERLKTVVDFNGTHGLHDFQYADSGGLQIVNTNAVVDDELKKKIYSYQAQNSDFAFSFDEIPAFKAEGEKYRTYVAEWVKPYSIKAGKNLQEHIDIFKSLGTTTKLIPIIQGVDYKQIEVYTKNMLAQVNKKDLSNIGALACGNAHGNGFGSLDSFMALHNMDIPVSMKKHTHLLGVSGIDRIVPVLMMIRNGLTPHLEQLSFDSSYHTQSYVYGEVQRTSEHLFKKTKIHRLGLERNQYVEDRMDELIDFWKDHETFNFVDREDLFKHSIYDSEGINSPAKQLKSRSEESFFKNVNLVQMYILFNIYKYISLLDDFLEDRISFIDIFHNDLYLKFYSDLSKVKTVGEYQDWRITYTNMSNFARAKNIVKISDTSEKNPMELLF